MRGTAFRMKVERTLGCLGRLRPYGHVIVDVNRLDPDRVANAEMRPSTVALNESRSNAILHPARAPRSVPYIHPATAATIWSSVEATSGPSLAP